MVVVRHLAEHHEVGLVVAVGVDLDGAVVAAGDVRPDGLAEVADLWRRRGVVSMRGWGGREIRGTYAWCPWLSCRSWRTRRPG